MRLALAAGIATAAGLAAWPAGASGDYGCATGWTLDNPDIECVSSIVMAPGNDTRVNLALLLRDRAGLASKPGTYPESGWSGSGHQSFSWREFSSALYPAEDWPENDYYGSRCVSLQGGDSAFTAAVAANRKLSPEEREALVAARSQLTPICESFGVAYWLRDDEAQAAPPPAWPVNVTSKQGKEFLSYLVSAAAFYGEDWDHARDGFAALGSASDPWLNETARYMQARLQLNLAQATAFDQWGDFEPEKVEHQPVEQAGKALAAYLKDYPNGAYAASAKGLQRRVLWLQGDLGAMAQTYEALLSASTPGSALEARLIEEADLKLLLADGKAVAAVLDTPLLLATYDLMRMRSTGSEESYYDYGQPPIDEAELAAQEQIFKGREELYQFLRANYSFYVAGDAQDVLLRIADNSTAASHSALDFSRQVLRGQALAAMKDPGEEAFWKRLIAGSTGLFQRPTAELGLALLWERSGQLGMVFAPSSPILETELRQILLRNVAGPGILRLAAADGERPREERNVALYTLLTKDLMRSYYADFLKDVAAVPPGVPTERYDPETYEYTAPAGVFTAGTFSKGYACPALVETVARLSRNPNDVKGRLCLGEFYRLNDFDYVGYDYGYDPEQAAGGTLGSGKEQFPGKLIPRGSFYRSIMVDPKADRSDRAYALYRAVRCYAPSGQNSCGDEEVELEQRKAWFNTLKRQYGDTPWAKELKYYW